MPSFSIDESDFLLDGQPFRILSGALHYFRVHPDYWADRIHKARLMGLNTIETYVAWNAHEPRRGQWSESGWNDLGHFLDLVQAEDMHAIVRPGPYICAEWHNGGLPEWLTSQPGIQLRRSNPGYLDAVREYLDHVYRIVAPRQVTNGGPVLLVQVENEYGAYGNDKDYLAELVRMTRDAGIGVPLTTVDQPTPHMLANGSLPGLHITGSFGAQAAERLGVLRQFQPTGPLMCSEFWCGWFDWWGGAHHRRNVESAAAELDTILASGASVNVYMFHGGTNFGLTNGANDKGRYEPVVTSYDYDAPLDEAGNPTDKFFAFRDVISRYAPVPQEVPAPPPPAPRFELPLRVAQQGLAPSWRPHESAQDATSSARVPPAPAQQGLTSASTSGTVQEPTVIQGSVATRGRESTQGLPASSPPSSPGRLPATFDELGLTSGLMLHSVSLPALAGLAVFSVDEVRDRASVSVDGVPCGVLDRSLRLTAVTIPPGARLDVLVEEEGRVNYGVRIGETKGLLGVARVAGQPLQGWTSTPINVEELVRHAALDPSGPPLTGPTPGPCVLVATFDLPAPADLFLDTGGWGKGFAFLNGFCVGRYWGIGPQRTLYLPAPLTAAGNNSLVIIELEAVVEPTVRFVSQALLGDPTQ